MTAIICPATLTAMNMNVQGWHNGDLRGQLPLLNVGGALRQVLVDEVCVTGVQVLLSPLLPLVQVPPLVPTLEGLQDPRRHVRVQPRLQHLAPHAFPPVVVRLSPEDVFVTGLPEELVHNLPVDIALQCLGARRHLFVHVRLQLREPALQERGGGPPGRVAPAAVGRGSIARLLMLMGRRFLKLLDLGGQFGVLQHVENFPDPLAHVQPRRLRADLAHEGLLLGLHVQLVDGVEVVEGVALDAGPR
eukprot:CAMPEP_0179357616 /NCGR_PEP_ID=MMETSP0797-20121207/78502_1 /TAXON_ID=47934 /ORGANISM="Dinophysis acuminata, Strain DAEP01" /LENGTH=245 /DNA_ID=CAMNT_0021072843 /DNA_START=26 /DNA_END=761 /DNA_ORIENTATION=+